MMSTKNPDNEFAAMEDTSIDLPLVNITKRDVLGALFVETDTLETFHDAILKLQTWIINFSEEQVTPLRESGCFTEEEIEVIKEKAKVISPITLTLYLQWLQMERFSQLSYSEKERMLLEKIPDRFKARYKGNISCRNAREISPEEESHVEDDIVEEENIKKHMTFKDFFISLAKGSE
ncbi:MAG: hypothetical protein J6Q22_10370 [Prevotella sp.]|nr:hypothetical protein [Prevotella sp.]